MYDCRKDDSNCNVPGNSCNYHNPDSPHLYQINPWEQEPPTLKWSWSWGTNPSWTSSLESYSAQSRKESYCLFHNGRRANFTLQLNLLRSYLIDDIPKLREELKKLFESLRRQKSIVAYAFVEVTRNETKTKPTDKVHLHFLIDTELNKDELTDQFHRACKAAKYSASDYRISKVENIAGIPDAEYKHRICNYTVKDGFVQKRLSEKDFSPKYSSEKVIMLKRNLGMHRVRTVGQWWVNQDGTPTTKKAIWKRASKNKGH